MTKDTTEPDYIKNRAKLEIEHDSCASSLSKIIPKKDIDYKYPLIDDEKINNLMTDYWYMIQSKNLNMMLIPYTKHPEIWLPLGIARMKKETYKKAIEDDGYIFSTLIQLNIIDREFLTNPTQTKQLMYGLMSDFCFFQTPQHGIVILVNDNFFDSNTPQGVQAKMIMCSFYVLRLLLLQHLLNTKNVTNERILQKIMSHARYFEGRFIDKFAPELISDPVFKKHHEYYTKHTLTENDLGLTESPFKEWYTFRTK